MILSRCYNEKDIKSVFLNDEMFDRIAEDGQDKEDFEVDAEANCFVRVDTECGLAGYYLLKPVNQTVLDIHAQILHNKREKYAFKSGLAMLEYFRNETPKQYNLLVCDIPVLYQDVISFCLKLGFKQYGRLPNSYKKHGSYHDRVMLTFER